MPCNTVTTATVELGRVDRGLLAQAMTDLGLEDWQYIEATGQVRVRGSYLDSEQVAKIKQAYSKQVVLSQAKKFGWKVKEVGAFRYEVQR